MTFAGDPAKALRPEKEADARRTFQSIDFFLGMQVKLHIESVTHRSKEQGARSKNHQGSNILLHCPESKRCPPTATAGINNPIGPLASMAAPMHIPAMSKAVLLFFCKYAESCQIESMTNDVSKPSVRTSFDMRWNACVVPSNRAAVIPVR